MVVEDDPATLSSLEAKLAELSGFEVVGSAESLAQARSLLSRIEPTLLLTDLALPDGDGVTLIEECTTQHPQTLILVFSVFGDERRVLSAIEAGARGFLLKTQSGIALEQALTEILRGGAPISPAIASHLIRQYAPDRPRAAAEPRLSERELEVLTLAARGYTYDEIAGLLEISRNTVGSYTKRIYEKLSVHSKSQAVFEGMRLGLVDQPDR